MTWGTVNVINNRLLYTGGADIETVSKDVYIHNEETGWHLSNIKIGESRFRHTSTVVNSSDISETYPGKDTYRKSSNIRRPQKIVALIFSQFLIGIGACLQDKFSILSHFCTPLIKGFDLMYQTFE